MALGQQGLLGQWGARAAGVLGQGSPRAVGRDISLHTPVIGGQTSMEATRLRPGKLESCVDITISRVTVNKSKTEISSQGRS